MSKNNVIIALVVLCLVGTIWGSVQDKKSESLERQIAAMKSGQVQSNSAVAEEGTAVISSEALETAQAQIGNLTSQNKELLAKAATLKGTIAGLEKEIAENGGKEAVAAVQADLDKSNAAVAALEETVAAVKADLDEKITALAAAEQATADLENVKNSLANSIDAYSEKSQGLAAELEEAALRVEALEKALEERSKLLVGNGKELSRTKLNMNVLLSRIAAQNNSLAILEETRVALEKELADKSLIIEDMKQQLGARNVVEAVTEEAVTEEEVVEPEEKVVEVEETVKTEEATEAPAPAE